MSNSEMSWRSSAVFEINESVGKALADNVALLLYGDGGVAVIPKRVAIERAATGSAAAVNEQEPPPGSATGRGLPKGWLSIRDAAATLGFEAVSLRRLIERNARRVADGGVEALVDGVRARKVGRTWRVQLSAAWTSTSPVAPRRSRVLHDVGGSARHGGNE